jgi:hypothetical protein
MWSEKESCLQNPKEARRRSSGTRRISADARLAKSHDEETISGSPALTPQRPTSPRKCLVQPEIDVPNAPEVSEPTEKRIRHATFSPLPNSDKGMSTDPSVPFALGVEETVSRAVSPPPSAHQDGALALDVNPPKTIQEDEETGKKIRQDTPPPCLKPGMAQPLDTRTNSRDAMSPGLNEAIIFSGEVSKMEESMGSAAHQARTFTELEALKKPREGLGGTMRSLDEGNRWLDAKRVISEINRNTEDLLAAQLQQPLQEEAGGKAARNESAFRRAVKGLTLSKRSSTDLETIELALERLLDRVREVERQTQGREGRVVGAA